MYNCYKGNSNYTHNYPQVHRTLKGQKAKPLEVVQLSMMTCFVMYDGEHRLTFCFIVNCISESLGILPFLKLYLYALQVNESDIKGIINLNKNGNKYVVKLYILND